MEKFTQREFEIFNLIRQGTSKSEIISAVDTTLACFNQALSGIYRKTDEVVHYHTERNKFEELQSYLKNNPTAFTPIPDAAPAGNSPQPKANMLPESKIGVILNKLTLKYNGESDRIAAKN